MMSPPDFVSHVSLKIISCVDSDPTKRRNGEDKHVFKVNTGEAIPAAVDGDLEGGLIGGCRDDGAEP
jgi:hypothetical protein